MNRIAHIVSDEKFIDAAFINFETIGICKNDYFCFQSSNDLQYIKTAQISIIKSLDDEIINKLNSYDLVIFHSMIELIKKRILISLSPQTKVLWLGWGADYYTKMGPEYINLYLPHTEKVLAQMKNYYGNRKFFELITKRFYQNQIDKYLRYRIKKSNWENRVDYFSPVLKTEFETIAFNKPEFGAQYIEWNYPIPLNDNISPKKSLNLLIGNSASYYNNHLDTFELLSHLTLSFDEVIVPLSYGGDTFYTDNVVKVGKQTFKDRFCPILRFMEVSEYNNKIDCSSHAIFNSKRQLAMGNIYYLLSNGTKLFLNEHSPAFIHLRKLEFYIFSMQDINENSLHKPLTNEQIASNFALAHQHIGQKKLLQNTQNLLSLVFPTL